jgi:phage tail sheath protein FI
MAVPIALEGADLLGAPLTADEVPNALAAALLGPTVLGTAADPDASLPERQVVVTLDNGSDGKAPGAVQYDGDLVSFSDYQNSPAASLFNGLRAFELLEDVAIVAAPGASTGWSGPAADTTKAARAGQALNNSVIAHCEKARYRVAVLDTPPHLSADDASGYRSGLSSAYAALYYPWITVSHPVDGSQLLVPPTPFIAGVWARRDINRGVHKTPADEVVRSALDLEAPLSTSQAELLNGQGVNCLRFVPGRGIVVWGARTISDDPGWKYVNIRRLFIYLERSIDAGTKWAVFEDNGPTLWSAIRSTVEDFLFAVWRNGALMGSRPDEAFFVRCDASTMTSDDLDKGRLVAEIGIAPVRPAEFVIFRIGQWTASTPSPPAGRPV